MHVDYEADHDVGEEHKPLHPKQEARKSLRQIFKDARTKTESSMSQIGIFPSR